MRVHFHPQIEFWVLQSIVGCDVSRDDTTGVTTIHDAGFTEFDALRHAGWVYTHKNGGVLYFKLPRKEKQRLPVVMPMTDANGFGSMGAGIVVPAHANRRTVLRYARGHFRRTREGLCVSVLFKSNRTPNFVPMTKGQILRFFPKGTKGPQPVA